jgi:hypothetical protein
MPSATDTNAAGARQSLSDLLDEYDNWRGTLDYCSGEFDAVEKIVALYCFAVANYDDPRIDLLLDAIAAVQTAGKDF